MNVFVNCSVKFDFQLQFVDSLIVAELEARPSSPLSQRLTKFEACNFTDHVSSSELEDSIGNMKRQFESQHARINTTIFSRMNDEHKIIHDSLQKVKNSLDQVSSLSSGLSDLESQLILLKRESKSMRDKLLELERKLEDQENQVANRDNNIRPGDFVNCPSYQNPRSVLPLFPTIHIELVKYGKIVKFGSILLSY